MGILGKPLAASGFPTLTIAYFHAPGLPHDLKKIPLEYFAKALRWLRKQPGVDPHRVYIMGASRGTEAAQLVAIHYPKLVHGAVLGSPTDFVHEGWTTDHGGQPLDTAAWTYRDKPIPHTSYSVDTGLLGSAMPVEDIDGPLLLACGGSDEVWDSCEASHRIIERLDRHHSPHRHVLLDYPRAGHGGGEFYPYDPLSVAGEGDRVGRTPFANQKARADSWPKLIHFLGQSTHRS